MADKKVEVEVDGRFHGINGKNSIFQFLGSNHCETDRFWRVQLGLTTERYFKGDELNWDECRNAYIKPKAPATLDILDHLHKYADYE